MSSGLLLFGGGGHCRSVIDVLEAALLPIAGIVHGTDCALDPVLGYSAVGRDDDLPALRECYASALVTVGQVKTPTIRKRLYALAKELSFSLPSIISPLAFVSRYAAVGEGTIVMHHGLVNAGARVGVNCIINSKALVEHDCIVGDHCHVAVGAVLCGGVRVGEGSFVGAGAVIHPMVNVGAGVVVGMGECVKHDISGSGAL